MRQTILRCIIGTACVVHTCSPTTVFAQDRELAADVLTAIERSQKLLVTLQNADGSWQAKTFGERYKSGVSGLALLALLSSGMDAREPAVQRGLAYFRDLPIAQPRTTYELAMAIMALTAANEPGRDAARIHAMAARLEEAQIRKGDNSGIWGYPSGGGDRSNGQFAALGLRDAANMGYPVQRRTWELIKRHWELAQNADGGWGYAPSRNQSTGSMTVAGVATLRICETMLRPDKQVNPDGTPICCERPRPNKALEKGIDWIANKFTVGYNPGGSSWHLYYLYGLERAGRLNGLRFFGEHDWYRAGARFLVDRQSIRGNFRAVSGHEAAPVIGGSFALLFLSKGLAPVLINKLSYGKPGRNLKPVSNDWNNHPNDARNLTELISGLPKWPKLLAAQTVNIHQLKGDAGVTELRQAPVTLITGGNQPEFSDEQVELLRKYIDQGGFIFAVNNCNRADFEDGFRQLVTRIFPEGDAELKRLTPDHPVFHSEHLLADDVELHGVDFGCRTSIIFSPDDLSCLWDKWQKAAIGGEPAKAQAEINLRTQITRSTRIGVNVIAYATGREPPKKLDIESVPGAKARDNLINRGVLRIAKLRHGGGWDTAPNAIRNLMHAMNESESTRAATKRFNIPINKEIGSFPIVYMHGRYPFTLNQTERDRIKKHLSYGCLMFADSCCGAKDFDRSFRDLVKKLYPDKELKRIPADHELFTTKIGHDLKKVKRRVNRAGGTGTQLEEGEPFLEGIEIDGRYVVIYSKYDISCALERQSTSACEGYVQKDAFKIAHNIVMYGMLQER